LAVLAQLEPHTRAAARGWSDLAIRNLFIIPTIAFLIGRRAPQQGPIEGRLQLVGHALLLGLVDVGSPRPDPSRQAIAAPSAEGIGVRLERLQTDG
jgi:hypothetical protein